MASSGTGSLIFISVTHDGSSKMNSEVYRNVSSANLMKDAAKLIGRWFIMHQDNNPKHTVVTTAELIKGNEFKTKSIFRLKSLRDVKSKSLGEHHCPNGRKHIF